MELLHQHVVPYYYPPLSEGEGRGEGSFVLVNLEGGPTGVAVTTPDATPVTTPATALTRKL